MPKTNGKRIAMIGHKLIPSRIGGVEVVVTHLAPKLVELGYTVTCYNRTNPKCKKAKKAGTLENTYRGVRLIWTPTVNRRGLAAASTSILASIMAAFGPYDLVHYHTEGPCVLCWLPRLMGKKVVVTVHGLDHQRKKWGKLASGYILQGEKAAVRHAHRIIVLARSAQTYFLERYGRQTDLIPNGIDPAEPREACEITRQFGLHSGEYILFLGRLVPEKGIHTLIEAYESLRTDKKLVITGNTSDTAAYVKELLAMAKDNSSIVFTGFQEGVVADELYSNAFVYVLPSTLEGMPLTLLEAMNLGCCCVTSDIDECLEVTEGSGLSFPRGNVEALRDVLQDLCDHPEKAEPYRRRAREVISEKHTWSEITDRTHALYSSLLSDDTKG
ncbi:MAG: glycosyltransferase family 4 protein [Clostridia bacterium]|nr:glycosyltransferase family 4 protein [Clostridia bacterium]